MRPVFVEKEFFNESPLARSASVHGVLSAEEESVEMSNRPGPAAEPSRRQAPASRFVGCSRSIATGQLTGSEAEHTAPLSRNAAAHTRLPQRLAPAVRLSQSQSPIDCEYLPGDEIRACGEEQDGLRNVRSSAISLHRSFRCEVL